MELRILDAAEVRQALPMAAAINATKIAFAQVAAGEVTLPLRTQIDVTDHSGVALFMPAYAAGSDALAIKAVAVYPDNPGRGLPTIHGVVLVIDAATGQPRALLEGGTLTAIRTGAASGAATDLLARPEARVAAIIGSGVQARTQLEAICTVRAIEEVRVYSLDRVQAESFARELAGQGPIPADIRVAPDGDSAVAGADVVCTATTSSTPVFSAAAISPGCHINAVGGYRPDMQEIPAGIVQRALLVVDQRTAVLAEAGDIIIPLRQGLFEETHIYAELGAIASGQQPGRTSESQITLFKSVGLAVQDAVAATAALERAQAEGLGSLVTL
ncbi:MAG: ornithine cyclodeaminase family protein [Anaerolineae bacterium]|nr:ornithine cyclodeaminase family protein [Anaerolineae bacterium]